MTFADIPTRSNSQRVDASWWNIIKEALIATFPSIAGETQITVTNNASAVDIPGMILDSSLFVFGKFGICVYRQDDTPNKFRTFATITLLFVSGTGWKIEVDYDNYDSVLTGITFDVNVTTGQVKYDTTNMTGTNYIGKARWQLLQKFSVES